MIRIKTDTPRTLPAAALALVVLLLAAACSSPPEEAQPASTATVFEGARLIVGDGSDPIENATIVVDGDRFVAVGATGEVEAPEGAAHVDLTGRTVIPALIDTHVHFSTEREALIENLQRKAYYGVGAAMGLGRDVGEAVYQVRAEDHPRRAALPARRPGDHHAGTGAHGDPVLDHDRGGGAGGRPGARRAGGRHRQDLGGRPRRPVREDDARAVHGGHRRGAPARTAGHGPHLRSRGRQGPAARRDRRVRPRRAGPGTSTTSSSSSCRSGRTSCWCRTCPAAAWPRT